jgi:hypothetical protein
MRYSLRTLLILMALAPPLLAGAWPVVAYLCKPAEPEAMFFVSTYFCGRCCPDENWTD